MCGDCTIDEMMKRFFLTLFIFITVCPLSYGVIIIRGRGSVSAGEAAPTSWIDTNSPNLVLVLYLQETNQPTGFIADSTTNKFDADSNGEPHYVGKSNGFFMGTAQDFFRTTNGLGDEIGTSSNISISGFFLPDQVANTFGIAEIGQFNNSTQSMLGAFLTSAGLTVRVREQSSPDLDVAFTNISSFSHFAMTFDGLETKWYTDGILIGTESTPGGIDSSGLEATIGAVFDIDLELDGRITKVHYFARTLSSNEILEAAQTDRGAYGFNTYTTDNVIAYYDMTNDVMGAHDDSGNFLGAQVKPTFANAPTFGVSVGTNINGREQFAVRADGSDDHLISFHQYDLNNDLDFGTNDFTIAGWFKADSVISGNNALFGRGWIGGFIGYGLTLKTNGVISFDVREAASFTQVTNDTPLPNDGTGVWHHVAGVREFGVEMSLWVDGVKQADTANETRDITVDEDFTVFSNPEENSFFDGLIAGVRVYNIAMTNIGGADGIYTNTIMPNGDIEVRLDNP